jgi:mono/diheme cytochrome c family protein
MRLVALALPLAALAWLLAGCNESGGSDPLIVGGQGYLAQCAVCHGPQGAGDGPLAATIVAEGSSRPARLDDAVRIGDLGREGVRSAIEGRAHARRQSPMPVWGPHLGPPWMDRIAAYVATLPSAGPGARAAVERYLASPPGVPTAARRTYVFYCSGCHGPDGRGDGFFSSAVAKQLHPRALDGAALAMLSDAQLEEILGMGGAHARDAATMPGWLHTLSPAERRDLAVYLRTLGRSAPAR